MEQQMRKLAKQIVDSPPDEIEELLMNQVEETGGILIAEISKDELPEDLQKLKRTSTNLTVENNYGSKLMIDLLLAVMEQKQPALKIIEQGEAIEYKKKQYQIKSLRFDLDSFTDQGLFKFYLKSATDATKCLSVTGSVPKKNLSEYLSILRNLKHRKLKKQIGALLQPMKYLPPQYEETIGVISSKLNIYIGELKDFKPYDSVEIGLSEILYAKKLSFLRGNKVQYKFVDLLPTKTKGKIEQIQKLLKTNDYSPETCKCYRSQGNSEEKNLSKLLKYIILFKSEASRPLILEGQILCENAINKKDLIDISKPTKGVKPELRKEQKEIVRFLLEIQKRLETQKRLERQKGKKMCF